MCFKPPWLLLSCIKARLHRRFLSRNSMQFLSRWSCNFNIARVNQLRFQRDFSAIYRAIAGDVSPVRRDLQNTVTLSSCFATAQAHTFCFGLICLILFRFASISYSFVSILFCFVLFYESAKTSANVNKLKKHRWRGGRCLLLFSVRFLALFTLMAVENLIHDCHILIKNRDKIASSFEQARNSCDIAAIKSHWNRSWFTRAIFKLHLRRDKNCIELRDKNRLCKRAFRNNNLKLERLRRHHLP